MLLGEGWWVWLVVGVIAHVRGAIITCQPCILIGINFHTHLITLALGLFCHYNQTNRNISDQSGCPDKTNQLSCHRSFPTPLEPVAALAM